MTTEEIAKKLIAYCKEGQWEQAYKELYSPNIKSMEPTAEGGWDTVEGMDGLAKKAEQWHNMVSGFHSSEISEPLVADNYITCVMKTNLTFKGQNEPTQMDEICLYTVKDGKIVVEQFFYTPFPA